MIRMMVGKDREGLPGVERVDNYPGAESHRIVHRMECPNDRKPEFLFALGPGCITEGTWTCHPHGPLFLETTHVGLVLSTGEYNGYDDSDFFAEVWNAEKGMPERIIFATTRGWSYPNSATVDATPEVLAAYRAYLDKRAADARALAAERERKAIRVGKDVKVVRGRKVPKGTVGRVTWMGIDKWGKDRIGLMEPNATRHFTAASNVEVIEEAA